MVRLDDQRRARAYRLSRSKQTDRHIDEKEEQVERVVNRGWQEPNENAWTIHLVLKSADGEADGGEPEHEDVSADITEPTPPTSSGS